MVEKRCIQNTRSFFTGYIIQIVAFNTAAYSSLSCAIYGKYFRDSNGLFIFKLVCLAMASFYFALREVLQILSLRKKGLQSQWFGDGKNALDALNIVMGFAWVGIFSICKQTNRLCHLRILVMMDARASRMAMCLYLHTHSFVLI